jgi:glycerol-3-phosphate O-acyltransferase
VRLSSVVRDAAAQRDVGPLLRAALSSFGTYHSKPVIERRGIRLHVCDSKLLFYYRNRLDGYGLRDAPTLVGGRGQLGRAAGARHV